MSKKGENIYKHKDGSWEVIKPVYRNENYNAILNTWLQTSKINIKESTYARYRQLILTHISPELGKYDISEITAPLIVEFIEKKLNNGRVDCNGGLSAKTVTDILNIIKSTVEYARNNDFAVKCNLSKLSLKKNDKEMRVLCHAEQKALMQVLLYNMDLYKFGVFLALCTGIRIGELCALQWENIRLEEGILKIRKTLQRIQVTESYGMNFGSRTKIIITEPKSKSSARDIPMNSFLIETARKFVNKPKAYVLSGIENKYIEPRTMENRFKKYICESGIEYANFHSLRHTFATRCVEAGFELKSLSEILGHSSVNITLNRYVHSSFELKASNMDKVSFI